MVEKVENMHKKRIKLLIKAKKGEETHAVKHM